MKKEIRGYIFGILFEVLVIIISIPIWTFAENKVKANNQIGLYDDIPISLMIDDFPELTIQDNDDLSNLNTGHLKLRNQNGFKKNYKLYYLYGKSSTISKDNIKLAINGKVYSLKDMKYDDKDDYYYYLIDEGSLKAYEDGETKINIWVTSDNLDYSGDLQIVSNFTTR